MFALQGVYLAVLTLFFRARGLVSGASHQSRHHAPLLMLMGSLPQLLAHPLVQKREEETGPADPEDPELWIYLSIAATLVLAGGAFAGLTIALMGQDEIYLQVIASSGDPVEKKHASRVLRLLKRGKHWVLVTLLLGNVITNETLPIVLDRSLGGGWPAVLGSTVLIVIFGEIIPQSVCVRYGLPIGAYLSPFVLVLMYALSPVAYPTAMLLDWLLGEDHGTTYKKAGLKTLVTLHKTLGTSPSDRLNQDEVTIISAVLDLKDKPVGSIMTPMDDTYIMSSDTVLDEETMDEILSAGYSRIPIHSPGDEQNFVGMLLVKMLITYDPEDALTVSDFALATLPETAPDTSCLDIVNFFQEGKSHMVLVSQFPGENFGALGVLTLEDVIEELIGEEIIDESDVYIDVHKAIRRLTPAPKARIIKNASRSTSVVSNMLEAPMSVADESEAETVKTSTLPTLTPAVTNSRLRAESDGAQRRPPAKITPEMKEHLKHLGPSNSAKNPKTTKYTSVKIKPGTLPEMLKTNGEDGLQRTPLSRITSQQGSDISRVATQSEATLSRVPSHQDVLKESPKEAPKESPETLTESPQELPQESQKSTSEVAPEVAPEESTKTSPKEVPQQESPLLRESQRGYGSLHTLTPKFASTSSLSPFSGNGNEAGRDRAREASTSSVYSHDSFRLARSGNIVESEIHVGGVRKVVVNVSSSSGSEDNAKAGKESIMSNESGPSTSNATGSVVADAKKKKRKRKKKNNKGKAGETEESAPLLKK